MTAFCKDCKHLFVKHEWTSDGTSKAYRVVWERSTCLSPKNKDDPNLVSGEENWCYTTAAEARRGLCGENAAWFEPKDWS